MKLLCFSTLYPNAADPNRGIFIEHRLRRLVETGAVQAKVIAPVPWFPFPQPVFKSYARFAKAPAQEVRHGIEIVHPRYVVVPKIGMHLTPYTLARCALSSAQRIIADGFHFDAIDAHYFYPDGVAAAVLAEKLAKPLMVTARGTDINLIPRSRIALARMRRAARTADALGAVCQALADEMDRLSFPSDKLHVLRNGVDLDLFCPGDRDEARKRWNLSGPTLLSVGSLIPRKGHHLTIEALRDLTDFTLLIAGEGPERTALASLAKRIGVSTRVRFLGPIAHEALPRLYQAADLSVLASSREGWANVILESLACGTPVIASDIWGTPEVIKAPEAGQLLSKRSAKAIVESVNAFWTARPARAETRAYAEGFSWAQTSQKQIDIFKDLVA